jgi:hypothetical protein
MVVYAFKRIYHSENSVMDKGDKFSFKFKNLSIFRFITIFITNVHAFCK